MHVLAPYLVRRYRHHRPLKLIYCPAGKSEVAVNHGLMPVQLALVEPPCPRGVSIGHTLQIQCPDFR